MDITGVRMPADRPRFSRQTDEIPMHTFVRGLLTDSMPWWRTGWNTMENNAPVRQ